MTSYEVISASSHLEVHPDVWSGHVEAAFRDALPELPTFDSSLVGASSSGGDPAKRLEELDSDGVDAEVLLPATLPGGALQSMGPEAQVAAVRGYNQWLSEVFTAPAPERLLGVGLLPVTRLVDSLDELERIASLPGIRAVLLQQWPNGSGAPAPSDDRFWDAALELQVPVCAWRNFGGGLPAATRPASCPEPMPLPIMLISGKCVTQSQLITEGVLDRFPSLQILFAGTDIGWIPDQIEQADDMFGRHRYWGGFPEQHSQRNYFPKHFKWSFTNDPFGVKVRHDIGVENILWSSDFPHDTSDWPRSRESLKEQLADVPEDEGRAIMAGNAVSFFHLDR
jgi:predicted TIM-barrel fold metal-dependent hydrolase